MTPFVTAGAGFLLAVLWFDLMHDVQVRRGRGHTDDGMTPSVASIAAYYRRVTTEARPMNRLVALMMLVTLAAIVGQIAAGDAPAWTAWGSLAFTLGAVGLAGARTVRNAVQLGQRAGTGDEDLRLARSIYYDHLTCLGLVASVLVIQLGFAR